MKREKRQPTQIEIMAAMEREKQEKKAARKAAKVRLESYRFPIFFFVGAESAGHHFTYMSIDCKSANLDMADRDMLPFLRCALACDQQEAKAEARKEREFQEKFGERKLTKKERKALEGLM